MLQTGNKLATWRLESLPSHQSAASIAAQRIGDHRIDYLTYEGPLTRDRGHVRRVDEGTCRILECSNTRWVVEFAGQALRGTWLLERSGAGEMTAWTFRRRI
jgi:hypothetical protein